MKLSVSQLRRIIKEEVTKAVMKEELSDDEKQEIEDAIAPILDSGIPLSKVISTIRDLEMGASARLGYEEPEPGESRLHSYGKQAMDEDYESSDFPGNDETDYDRDWKRRVDAWKRERSERTGESYGDEHAKNWEDPERDYFRSAGGN